MQGAAQRPGELSSHVCQGNAACVVTLQPPSFGSESHGSVRGAIESADRSPRHRITVGCLMKQTYQRKCHRFGVVGHW